MVSKGAMLLSTRHLSRTCQPVFSATEGESAVA
jgi:hypothetical protein